MPQMGQNSKSEGHRQIQKSPGDHAAMADIIDNQAEAGYRGW
jgi:hypothetical protein